MRTKTGFRDYARAAFHARPLGMFVPPNWIGLAAFGLLGLANPGFWLIGAGLEVVYLLGLATHPRFQKSVAAARMAEAGNRSQPRHDELVARLGAEDRNRYLAFVERCRSVLEQHPDNPPPSDALEAQSESLGRLAWMYLRLLIMRQPIDKLVADMSRGEAETGLEKRLRELKASLSATAADELRKSLASQVEILEQRIRGREEAHAKLAYLDAELARLREQVELIREQAILSSDPELLSRRIDEITATLDGTAQWLHAQKQIDGVVSDLTVDPPALSLPTRSRERH